MDRRQQLARMLHYPANSIARVIKRASKSTFAVCDQGMLAASNLLVAVYVARELGVGTMGIYALSMTIIAAFSVLQGALFIESLSVFGPNKKGHQIRSYLSYMILSMIIVNSAISTTVISLVYIIWKFDIILFEHLYITLYTIGYANAFSLQQLIRRYYYIDQLPKIAFLQSGAYVTLVVVGLVVLSASNHPDLVKVYIVLLISSSIVSATQLSLWVGRFGAVDRQTLRQYSSEQWQFSSWLLLSAPFSLGFHHFMYLIVGYILGPSATGLIKTLDVLIGPFTQAWIALNGLFMPQAAARFPRLTINGQKAWAARTSISMAGLGLAYAILLIMIGSDLIDLIFGPEYSQAKALIWIYALVPIIHGAIFGFQITLTVNRRTDLRFLVFFSSTVAGWLVTLALTHLFGLSGAAWGLILSMAAVLALSWLLVTIHWR